MITAVKWSQRDSRTTPYSILPTGTQICKSEWDWHRCFMSCGVQESCGLCWTLFHRCDGLGALQRKSWPEPYFLQRSCCGGSLCFSLVCFTGIPATVWGWNSALSPDPSKFMSGAVFTKKLTLVKDFFLPPSQFFICIWSCLYSVGPPVCKFCNFSVQQAISDESFNKTLHPALCTS